MQRYSAIAIICLSFLLPANHSVLSAADIPSPADLKPLGLELRWSSQAVLDVGRDVVAFVTNDESNVYVQSSGGILTVFNAENGRKLWSAQIGRLNEPASSAISNKNLFVVVVGPVIYGFNKFTGMPVFEQRLPYVPSASPVINESSLFVPVSGGAIYAYSLGVLEYSYRYGKLPDTDARPYLWRYIGREEIIRPPALGEKALAFATEAGNLVSIATRGIAPGRTEFQMQLNKPASAALAIADNKTSSSILMLTEDNLVFSVDLLKGSAEWVYPMGRPMQETPIVIGDDVYIVTTEGSLTRLTRNNFSPNWGRPVEIPLFKSPTLIGVGVEDVEIDPQVKDDLELVGSSGILVKEVEADSPGAGCGLKSGDIIFSINDITVATVNELKASLAELARRVERPIRVVRDGKIVSLKLVIPSRQWDVQGIDGVAAIGRFSVFGIDGSRRLVAFDKSTAAITGRTSVADYGFLHHNYLTDQVFLVSESGEIVCLREIGPTFRMPEVSSASNHAKVVKLNVKLGDVVEETGTAICDIELPDGTVVPLTANLKGTIREVYVSEGQSITIGAPLVLVADDKFATYYRNPEQRPIDVELLDPNDVQPTEPE